MSQIVIYYEGVYDENSRSLQTTHFCKQGTLGNIKFSVSNENNLMGLCLFVIKRNVKKKKLIPPKGLNVNSEDWEYIKHLLQV